jgi:hypothetical protein
MRRRVELTRRDGLGGFLLRTARAIEILDSAHIGVDERLHVFVLELPSREAVPLDPAGQAMVFTSAIHAYSESPGS